MNMEKETIQQSNKKKRNSLIYQNYLITARGTIHKEYISFDCYEYGLIGVSFWIPATQSWIPSNNTFTIQADTHDNAKALFWDKWQNYLIRRFNRKNIKLELI